MSYVDPATEKHEESRDTEGLAKRLRLAREHAGLTQQQFADQSAIPGAKSCPGKTQQTCLLFGR